MDMVSEDDCEEQLSAEMSQLGSSWHSNSDSNSDSNSEELLCPCEDPYAESVCSDDDRRMMVKRKVLRHRPDGGVEISHETVCYGPENTAEPWCLGKTKTFMDDTFSDGHLENSNSLAKYLNFDDDWLLEDSPRSLLGDFGNERMSRYSVGARPKAYIVPTRDKHQRTDPTAALKRYRREWQRFSFPGEDRHEKVRWVVRQRMLNPGMLHQKQKRPATSKYAAPMTKQRSMPTMRQRGAKRRGKRKEATFCLMPCPNICC
ncbi:centriolar and ciliogenesis-associated protein HYLS1 [Malurus melanocephalus]|uniref:centriolar and ciliogenesis-associated protein HYLS1 n=1 Tax=Malurus melanocephalus TaxID=175006 RepID=UPI0025486F47|nr:centriolar and ciliogenesis-associated protein HYLS1 [Malurus melanocephalus]